MAVTMLDPRRQHAAIAGQIEAALIEVLNSGRYIGGGKISELEEKIAAYCGCAHAVGVSSGTDALLASLMALGVGPGDEVATTVYSFFATAGVIVRVGATPVFCDIDRATFNIDPADLARRLTPRTKAIIPVDLGGVPIQYERVWDAIQNKRSLFRANNKYQEALGRIALCVDAAHALGAKYRGTTIAAHSDFSAYSFHAVKNLTTAEGGALLWKTLPGIDDAEIYKLLQLLSLHGQSKDALAKTQLGAWEYDVVGPWYKCNMTDVLAGMGLAQFRRYSSMLARRRAIIERYDAAFHPLGVKTLRHYADEYESSGHLYLTRVPNADAQERNRVVVAMAERGIACNVHYKPLPAFTAYKNLGFDIANFPNAYNLFVNEITLPLHTKLTDDEVEYVIENYRDILKQRR